MISRAEGLEVSGQFILDHSMFYDMFALIELLIPFHVGTKPRPRFLPMKLKPHLSEIQVNKPNL